MGRSHIMRKDISTMIKEERKKPLLIIKIIVITQSMEKKLVPLEEKIGVIRNRIMDTKYPKK